MFIKLHLWQEDQTITTLTIVDMAGYPGKVGQESSKMNSPRNFVRAYSDNHSEINTTGVNYLMYVFKDMMFKGNQKAKKSLFSFVSRKKPLSHFCNPQHIVFLK